MKKTKLKLGDLKVSSFITKANHLKGGRIPIEQEPIDPLTLRSCLSCIALCTNDCPSMQITCGTECTCNDLICNNTNPICIA
ncbi:MAG: pinensin family lanthipeptide [Cyclobacteriaceae bacterium]